MNWKTVFIAALFLSFCRLAYADPYRFQPGDYIDIYVYGQPELTGEFRIFADGNIRLPLVGKVQLEGLSENEAHDSLIEVIGEFLINPNITIAAKYSVSVMGHVVRSGVFQVTDSNRIIEVIALAGGFTNDASQSITVYRDGERINISKNEILQKDSPLGFARPGDVIYAKRKLFTRGDYSLLLSSISIITMAIYYYNR